jgi:septum formation protein
MRPVKFILASKSPRRKELLKRIIPADQIVVYGSNVSEKHRRDEPVDTFCMRIAEAKVAQVWGAYPGERAEIAAVIGADTVVLFKQEIIGQPEDGQDAIRILKKLSGKTHEVITGVAVFLQSPARFKAFAVKSKVWMRETSEATIKDYVATGEPLDKAGAYAIQGTGRRLVARYEGSLTNIIGLPIEELYEILSSVI